MENAELRAAKRRMRLLERENEVASPVTEAELGEAQLANAVFDAHRDDPDRSAFSPTKSAKVASRSVIERCGGSARTTAGGRRSPSPRTARRASPERRPTTTSSVGTSADGPNQLWLADITEHHTGEGKLYLCAIKDCFSNRIVGWAIDSRMKARIVVAAIEMAVARRGDVAGCILHSDRGSQFRARKAQRALTRYRMVGSMGQVGSAGDNAAMESFFALVQKNVLNRRRWATRDDLRIAIVTWIERTYHRRRRQAALGRMTPVDYEMIMTPQATQAA